MVTVVEFDSSVDELLESGEPLTANGELVGDSSRQTFPKMKSEGGIIPFNSGLINPELRNISRSFAVVLHVEIVEFELGIPNLIRVSEQGEELLFEPFPVVEDTGRFDIFEVFEKWLEPLGGTPT